MVRNVEEPAPYDPIIGKARAFSKLELGIGWADLNSASRLPHLVRARALFVWICKTHGPTWLSYPIIGWWLGDRDHTTVMHLWRNVVPRLRERDEAFVALCDKFTQQLETKA